METGRPCRNTPYFGFSCLYLKNELGEPHFLLHKGDQQTKMKLSAKFKKILCSGFRATLNFQLITVALNQKVLSWHVDYIPEIKIGGHRVSILRYKKLKPKYGVFLVHYNLVHYNWIGTIVLEQMYTRMKD